MPQQATQTNSAQAAEDSVKAFMSLDEGGQSKALAKMSPEAKNSLLLGVRAMKSFEPQQAPQKEDEGVLKGFADRVVGTFKGIKQMVMPSEAEDVEAIKAHAPSRIGETYREGGRQVKEQASKSLQSFKAGLPVEGTLGAARTVTTAASLANPLATGSVVDINRMQDEGRMKEAIGAGAFDVLNLLAAKSSGTSKTTGQLNKIVGATGVELSDAERVLPEIEEASKKMGRAKTVGQFQDIIEQGSLLKEGEFKRYFDPIKSRRAYTPIIKNHIDRIIRENPNLAQTADGREELAAMRRVLREYDKPHTLEFMNLERSRLRNQMRAYYEAPPTDKIARLKGDAEFRAKKVVADSFSETVNDHLAHVTGKPKEYFDILRQKQEAFLNMKDHLSKEIENLRNKEASQAGKNVSERFKPHAYASAGGPRVHVPFGEAVPSAGPMAQADSKVKQAFRRGGPENRAKTVTRAALRALPITHLLTAGEEAKKSRMTPPPSPDE